MASPTHRAMQEGHELKKILGLLENDLANTKVLVGHNIESTLILLEQS